MIDYETFSSILNRHIFGQEKIMLLKRIAENPDRYVGLFRPTKAEGKILQNIFQSREIRFGDAMEEVVKTFLSSEGYDILNSRVAPKLEVDIYFAKDGIFYMLEQKIRDDHDSTKKRGQFDNFKKKFTLLFSKHSHNLQGIMWFIDPSLTKNKNYYLKQISDSQTELDYEYIFLFYGQEFFDYLGLTDFWPRLLQWLLNWRESLPTIPDINMDADSTDSFNQLRRLEKKYWRKLIREDRLWTHGGTMHVLFRTGKTLHQMANYFHQNGDLLLASGLIERIRQMRARD